MQCHPASIFFDCLRARHGARLLDSQRRRRNPGRRPFAAVVSRGMRVSGGDAIGGVLALMIFRASRSSRAVQAGNQRLK
jgi:hypothetical protein